MTNFRSLTKTGVTPTQPSFYTAHFSRLGRWPKTQREHVAVILLQRLRPYLQGFFNQYTSALHPLLPCILPAPCQEGICVAVQRARSGNQGISFPGSINASTGTREVIGTSSQGRKGPSPSAKTHTYVRLKWSQPQLPAHSSHFLQAWQLPSSVEDQVV